MIHILMNQKLGLNRFSKLPDDGDPLALNNLLTPVRSKRKKHQLDPGGPSNRQEAPDFYLKKSVVLIFLRSGKFNVLIIFYFYIKLIFI